MSFSMSQALEIVRQRKEQEQRANEEKERAKEEERKERARAKRRRRRQNQKLIRAKIKANEQEAEGELMSEESDSDNETAGATNDDALMDARDESPDASELSSKNKRSHHTINDSGESEDPKSEPHIAKKQKISGKPKRKRKFKASKHVSDTSGKDKHSPNSEPRRLVSRLPSLVPRAVLLKRAEED